MSKNALVLRRFTLGDNGFLKGAVIFDMADNQFDDLAACELVREAADDEIAAALPPEEAPAAKPAKRSQPRTRTAAKAPAAAPIAPTPPATPDAAEAEQPAG